MYTVRYSQVSYITSSLHIVNFHKTDGSILQCRGKLKDFEKQLDDSTFLRCHQSFIVNMERVTGAENDSFHIGEHVIPISRSYNRNAHEKYDEYLKTFSRNTRGRRKELTELYSFILDQLR